jgi:hypothetical protein
MSSDDSPVTESPRGDRGMLANDIEIGEGPRLVAQTVWIVTGRPGFE